MLDKPIGMFDSGVGGLCVLEKCTKLLPYEDFLYLADSANMPYGGKTPGEIRAAALKCADILFGRGCKALVVACNTATENAIDLIRHEYPDRIVVGLEPAIKPCYRELKSGYALALVTAATERSPRFKRLMSAYGDRIVSVSTELASAIEHNIDNIGSLRPYVYGILEPYPDAEAVILGCSHYTYITQLILDNYGGAITVYDGADGAAKRLAQLISLSGLSADRGGISGRVEYINTREDRLRS